MKDARNTSLSLQSCFWISPTFCGKMPTLKKLSESSSLPSTHSNGRVYTKFGFLTFRSLSADMEMIRLVSREQDLCLKDCSKLVPSNILVSSIICMRNLKSNMEWFLMQSTFTILWSIKLQNKRDLKHIVFTLVKWLKYLVLLRRGLFLKPLFKSCLKSRFWGSVGNTPS